MERNREREREREKRNERRVREQTWIDSPFVEWIGCGGPWFIQRSLIDLRRWTFRLWL